MLLLGANKGTPAEPDVWTACAAFRAGAEEVLDALTDPERISTWSPVGFDVAGLAGGRLRAGTCERVSGTIAGVGASFDVEVARADCRRLELVARGPVSFEVAYSLREQATGVLVEARVAIRRQRGLTAQLLRAAAAALLNAGALTGALRRLESSLVCTSACELVAA